MGIGIGVVGCDEKIVGQEELKLEELAVKVKVVMGKDTEEDVGVEGVVASPDMVEVLLPYVLVEVKAMVDAH